MGILLGVDPLLYLLHKSLGRHLQKHQARSLVKLPIVSMVSRVGFLIFAIFLISRNTKRYESLASFAKILLVSRNKNMRNFVSFRFALKKLKRNFASFRKNLVSIRENFVLFRIEREIFCRNSRKKQRWAFR